MQCCRAIASTNSLEKKKEKKDKSTEKHNITPDFEKFHFYKNGNIINKLRISCAHLAQMLMSSEYLSAKFQHTNGSMMQN